MKEQALTPLETKAMACVVDGRLTVSQTQRLLKVSFVKACELVYSLTEKNLVQSNIREWRIERLG